MKKEYTTEMKEQTAIYVLETGKSATKVAKEIGATVNTVCRWVKEYKEKHGIINKGSKPATNDEMQQRIKELERQLKEKERELQEEKKRVVEARNSVEILKKSLCIFTEPHA